MLCIFLHTYLHTYIYINIHIYLYIYGTHIVGCVHVWDERDGALSLLQQLPVDPVLVEEGVLAEAFDAVSAKPVLADTDLHISDG